MSKTEHTEAERAAIRLASRTLEYVSTKGEEPEPMMDCDLEMWKLAQAVLASLGQVIPAKQRSTAAWVKAIYQAKATGLAA